MAVEGTAAVDLSNKDLDRIPDEVLLKCDSVRILDLSGNNAIRLEDSLNVFRNVIKLVLNRCALPGIPDEISELTKLEDLDVSENTFFGGLNPALGRLGRLKTLSACSCMLASLSDAIGDMDQLEDLDVSSNNFSGGLNAVLGRLGRLKTLNLSSCKLTSLPDWIGVLEQLEDLLVSDNDFSGGLNTALGRLGRLKNLTLSSCKLRSLPDWIGALEQLEELYVFFNDFSDGLNSAIGRLARLKKLDLSNCNLTSLPDWIGALEQLEELYVSFNYFSDSLNTTLRRLGRLKKLDLSNCQLKSLPDWIGGLEQLEDLLVSGNDFSGGPNAALGRLGQLKKLDFNNCNLTSLPDWIGALEQLEELIVFDNDFSGGLNKALGRLGRLKKLDLHRCILTRLPDTIGALEQVEDLLLSDNNFSDGLNSAIGRLARLKRLDLSSCKLTSLPDWIGALEQLEDLVVSHNDFSGGLNMALGRLGRLKKLDLFGCMLTSLPNWIGALEQLEDLNVSSNKLSGGLNAALGRLGRLRKLSLSRCNLTSLPDWICALEQLEELAGCYNNFSAGLNTAIGRLRRVKKLDLRACKLTSLPDWIGALEQLEELHMPFNNFSAGLNTALGRLRRLKKLDLSNCKLTSLPNWIGALEQLEVLRVFFNDFSDGRSAALVRLGRLQNLELSSCNLTTVPDWVGALDQLENLFLAGNDFSGGLNPPLERLEALKNLDLKSCRLTSIPDWIGALEQLVELHMPFNDFSAGLNATLGRLRRLKKLDLSSCKLTTLPDWIGALEQLEDLLVSDNDFSGGLNMALERLEALKILNLRSCKLTSLPDWIGALEQLEELLLSDNAFSDRLNTALRRLGRLKKLDLRCCKLAILPDWIGALEQLLTLDVRQNRLEDYPRCTLRLKRLYELYLSNDEFHVKSSNTDIQQNCITQLPVELAFTHLCHLYLDGNPITEPPKEIWEQGIYAIRSFMRGLLPGGEPLSADTVSMLGDTGAGKTSVAQSLIAKVPDPTKAADHTQVMQQLRMTMDNVSGSVIINDFGGHEIYHSVMQIFLPKSGLLMLVFDVTANIEDLKQSIKKWMLTAIAKSEEIRIVIVGTHADKLESPSERSYLEEQMKELSKDVLCRAYTEVTSHVSHIKSWQNDSSLKRNKLNRLHLLLSNIQSAMVAMRVVTLSCSVPDVGLSGLHKLVEEMMRRPQSFPVQWCRFINEIFKFRPSGFYVEMLEVQQIAKTFLTNEDEKALETILHYLSKMSLIIWVDDHPRLKKLIFHLPQKIIDVCKEILHHDSEILRDLYKSDWDKYEKGIVREPLLRDVVEEQRSRVKIARSPGLLPTFEDAVDFLEKFNIISQVATNSKERTFIIPCKLTSHEPSELEHFNVAERNCRYRIAVRLSFIGSMVPLSFFETCLSAMLTVATRLSPCDNFPWKSGFIVFRDGVSFLAKLSEKEGRITLTACCESSAASLWTVLQPMLQCLNEHAATWHGAPPKCSVECPHCVRSRQHANLQSEVGEIETDIRQLAGLEREDNASSRRCPLCSRWTEQSLCLPPASSGIKRKEPSQNEGPLCKDSRLQDAQGWASERGRAFVASRDSRLPSILDGMELQQLQYSLRRNFDTVTTTLTFPEIAQIASTLDSMSLIIPEEKETILLETNTSIKAARILVDIILKKNERKRYCAFIEILEGSPLYRHDLVAALTS